jgi:hypothetical protein
LFEASQFGNWFDVARDGRFLMVKSDESQPISQLNPVQNWVEDLRRRVPAK